MRIFPAIATVALGFALAVPLRAHRVEGLLQASLVEVLPAQVGVEVTLVPGIDIAPEVVALLDADGDGVFSKAESKAWAARFMAGQSVTVDGRSLPLDLKSILASPLAEMAGGHAEIVVRFTADLGPLASGPRTIVCGNRYEAIPSTYQSNGLVPKAPGVRLSSHRRDERQQELTLAAEFSAPATSATQPAQVARSANIVPPDPPDVAVRWLVGLNVAGGIAIVVAKRRRRSAKAGL